MCNDYDIQDTSQPWGRGLRRLDETMILMVSCIGPGRANLKMLPQQVSLTLPDSTMFSPAISYARRSAFRQIKFYIAGSYYTAATCFAINKSERAGAKHVMHGASLKTTG
ncbi:hypothetical protein RRG08_029635 [Elysia crispata]|uniref:Uncharacterized protein n=1 Tax=Elysia crispata TaxID=231223 RepID=A0AAE1CK07_9GAST|nr:hypothetical protein RRG08_029635 [Elysia crispata]